MLPFTAEVLFSLLAQYSRAIWPVQLLGLALGLAAILLTLKPFPVGGRLIGLALAAAWAWTGVAWHLIHFATINFAAPAYAALFLLQAALLGWTVTVRGRPAFRAPSPKLWSVGDFRTDPFGWAGLGLAIFALAVDPLLALLAGHGWAAAPAFGVAPGPTTIFTMGMLLLADGRAPLHLAAIPVLWSLIAGATAWILDTPEGFTVPLAGIGGLCLILWKNRRARG